LKRRKKEKIADRSNKHRSTPANKGKERGDLERVRGLTKTSRTG
jgi:hypothetical protein